MAKKEKAGSEAKALEPVFTKQQIVKSKKYAVYRDFVAANFEEGKTYTFAEIDKKLKIKKEED